MRPKSNETPIPKRLGHNVNKHRLKEEVTKGWKRKRWGNMLQPIRLTDNRSATGFKKSTVERKSLTDVKIHKF